MELNVGHRIRLLNILPEQGNLLTIKIVRQLREELSFTEEEHQKFAVKIEGNRLMWDADNLETKSVEFGPKATELVEKRLRELNDEDKLTVGDLELWEMFIGEI